MVGEFTLCCRFSCCVVLVLDVLPLVICGVGTVVLRLLGLWVLCFGFI